MGTYDILVYRKRECQTKTWDCNLTVYRCGDNVPKIGNVSSYVIEFPEYEGAKYAVIVSSRFVRLTDDLTESESFLSRFSKWGSRMF